MEICKEVRKELDSFETSELERLLEAIEWEVLYTSGLKNISGGYANATAYDIYIEDDWDDEGNEIDLIEVEVESGECGDNYVDSFKTTHHLKRNVLGDHNMTLKEKIRSVVEA